MDLPPLPDDDRTLRTRNAWHALAEHVLAPACHDTARRIGLVVVPGGFGTPPFERGRGPEEVHVVGHELVVHRDARRETRPIRTVREAAAFVDVTPGAPTEVFRPSQPLELDRTLEIDDSAAAAFGQWFALGWAVLTELRDSADAEDAPSPVQLWPEHLDAAVELGNAATKQRGTFGVSLGDADHPEPYLYVTHWSTAIRRSVLERPVVRRCEPRVRRRSRRNRSGGRRPGVLRRRPDSPTRVVSRAIEVRDGFGRLDEGRPFGSDRQQLPRHPGRLLVVEVDVVRARPTPRAGPPMRSGSDRRGRTRSGRPTTP